MKLRTHAPSDRNALYEIWHAAVTATHDFVSPEDMVEISKAVREEYLPVADFVVAEDDEGRAVGFMGLTGRNIDALFLHPRAHRQGIGRALVDHAVATAGPVLTVDVNEQNRGAVAFYRHLGFEPVGHSELDDEGRPYPLLHLRLVREDG